MDFKVGDIVQLKSSKQKMTIQRIIDPTKAPLLPDTLDPSVRKDNIHCQWFAGSKLQDGWFNPETLVKVEEKDE